MAERKEEVGTEVTVLPIPYYLRDAKGAKKEAYYEGDQYPDYLGVQDYQTYDIEKVHPDIIFIQARMTAITTRLPWLRSIILL